MSGPTVAKIGFTPGKATLVVIREGGGDVSDPYGPDGGDQPVFFGGGAILLKTSVADTEVGTWENDFRVHLHVDAADRLLRGQGWTRWPTDHPSGEWVSSGVVWMANVHPIDP